METQNEIKTTELAPESAEQKQKPELTLKAKDVTVSIWRNKLQDGSFTYSVTPTRNWRDKEGIWHHPTSLFEKNLLPMAKLLEEAWAYIREADK